MRNYSWLDKAAIVSVVFAIVGLAGIFALVKLFALEDWIGVLLAVWFAPVGFWLLCFWSVMARDEPIGTLKACGVLCLLGAIANGFDLGASFRIFAVFALVSGALAIVAPVARSLLNFGRPRHLRWY